MNITQYATVAGILDSHRIANDIRAAVMADLYHTLPARTRYTLRTIATLVADNPQLADTIARDAERARDAIPVTRR